MTANEIKAALVLRGIKITDIARELGVSFEAVGRVVRRQQRSARVEAVVARILNMPPSDVFGSPTNRATIGKSISIPQPAGGTVPHE